MFQKLQTKWKVSGWRFFFVVLTFAVGGSLCGYAGRKLLSLTSMDKGVLWLVCYIILITLLWPLCVLLVSIPLGQFSFFKNYIQKIAGRLSGKKQRTTSASKINMAIFASGAGSNAKNIIEHFKDHPLIAVALIVCNKPGAGVLTIAADNNIPVLMIDKEVFFRGNHYIQELKGYKIDWLILAGFLWKVPSELVKAYAGNIINIHPALLPKYGGKGMYGHHVHEAVRKNNEAETGITIHFVDEVYDNGEIIKQAKCMVTAEDDALAIAAKVHALEYSWYPKIIEERLSDAKSSLKQNRINS